MILVLGLGLLHVIGAGIAARAAAGTVVGRADAGAGRLFHAMGAGGIGSRGGGRGIGRAGLGQGGAGQAETQDQGAEQGRDTHGRTPLDGCTPFRHLPRGEVPRRGSAAAGAGLVDLLVRHLLVVGGGLLAGLGRAAARRGRRCRRIGGRRLGEGGGGGQQAGEGQAEGGAFHGSHSFGG